MVDISQVAAGGRLRQLRREKGLSIRELSRRCDVSHVTVSLIERGRHSPSISTLKTILHALDTTLSAFFSEPLPKTVPVIHRADELVELADGETLSYRQVGSNLSSASMMILHERYAPGADTGESLYHHIGEEGGVVVEGRLELIVDGEVYVLEAGDAYLFDSRRPHRMRNPFEEPCVVVSATTPPTF